MDQNQEVKEAEVIVENEKPKEERPDLKAKEEKKIKFFLKDNYVFAYFVALMFLMLFIIAISWGNTNTNKLNNCQSGFLDYNSTHTIEKKAILQDFNQIYQAKSGNKITIIPKLINENESNYTSIYFDDPFDKNGIWEVPKNYSGWFFTSVEARQGGNIGSIDRKIIKIEVI